MNQPNFFLDFPRFDRYFGCHFVFVQKMDRVNHKQKGMKYRLALVLSLCGSLSGLAIEKADLEDASTKRSYGLGANYGKSLSRGSIEINVQSFMDGLKDGIAGKSLLTDTEIQAVIDSINQEIREKQKRKQEELAEKNKKDGEDFLAANRQKDGVVALDSGLQYKIIREGNGDIPKATDKVKVHYRGTLIDGTVFDSSYERGVPAEFFVRGVIKGWTEALQLMKTGAKWQLYIPSELAYGERGTGSTIGPNETLLFDVELLDITTTPKPKPKPITSDIIKVPSAEAIKKGAKPEVIKADQIHDYIEKEKKKAQEAKAKEESGKNAKDADPAAEDTISTEEKNPKPSQENSSNKEQEESPQKDQS